MAETINQLQSLRQTDADVAFILNVYDEIDRVYKAALEAMGCGNSTHDVVKNSADVTISFHPDDSVDSLTFRQ